MKNKLLVLSLLLITIFAFGQGRRINQWGVHGQYGYIPANDTIKNGSYMAMVGYNHVVGDKGFLGKIEAFYLDTKVGYTFGQFLPYEKYGFNVSAGYSYEGLYPIFVNAYVGAFGAYEKVNDGNQRDPLFRAQIPTNVKGFTFGISGSVELEIVLFRKISLIANYTQFCDFKSEFSKSNYALFGGLKYYIN